MKTYQLHVKVGGGWEWLCTIDAATHAEAFHRVIYCLGTLHENSPIRLEQDLEGIYRKPCAPDGTPSGPPTNG